MSIEINSNLTIGIFYVHIFKKKNVRKKWNYHYTPSNIENCIKHGSATSYFFPVGEELKKKFDDVEVKKECIDKFVSSQYGSDKVTPLNSLNIWMKFVKFSQKKFLSIIWG